jgi:hypothetical protein
MSKLGKRSLLDNDQLLEGGIGGAGMGYRSGVKEATTRRAKKPEKSYFEMTDAEINALTPAQRRKFGSDVTFDRLKSGGTASSRADGCCVKGNTKGRMR